MMKLLTLNAEKNAINDLLREKKKIWRFAKQDIRIHHKGTIMFTRSHLQELKRRYASIYAPPTEDEVIEDGTIEGVNQYKKDTPGQEIDKEFKEHCGVCGEQGIKEDEIEEGTSLQVKMALSDVGLKGTWKNGKVYVKKRDVKKAEKALKGNVIYRGKPPVVVGENFFNKIREVIDLKKSSMGTVIKDFQDSDAPQFKGKSDKKRREMAIAAKLAADRNESVKEDEKDDPKSKKKDKINLKPKMDEKMAKTYKEMLKYIKKEKKSTEEVKEAVTDGGIEYGEQDWDAHYRLDHAYPNLGVNYAEFHEQELEGPYQIDGAAYFFDRKVGSWYSVESEDYVDDEKSKELSFRYVKDGMYKPQFSN